MVDALWRTTRRLLRIAERDYPEALRIAVLPGPDYVGATVALAETFGDRRLESSDRRYPVLVFDRQGLHCITRSGPPHPLIPSSAIRVGELASTPIGLRNVAVIVLEIATGGATIELPVVPLRRGWGILRYHRLHELAAIRTEISEALRGRTRASYRPGA